jgi:predicted small lipoprotein YifL
MDSLSKRRGFKAFTRIWVGLAVLLIGAGLPAGCGIKGPPKLPKSEAPAGVRNLTATLEGAAILLKWTGGAAAGYHVYRSADPVGEDACEGCPVLFKKVGSVAVPDGAQTPQPLTYREAWVPGTRYRFKVVPYDDQGQLGPDSNVARITVE